MANQNRTVTIQDVARTAGVSVSTVSRVLNGKVDVANQTRQHVLEVIEELGYTSNLAARSMRSRRKNLIGLVVPDIGFPYSIEIMKGINRAISGSTFDLLVYTTGEVKKAGTQTREQHYVSLLNNSLADGVIIVASAAAEFNTHAPIVAVDPHIINPNYPSVQGTNYKGALDVMEHLYGLGHQRVAFIGGRPEIGSGVRRLEAYRDSREKFNLDADPALEVPGDFTTETGYKRTRQLLSLDRPPTAIFASNDQSAIGVFQAAQEKGVRIPEDLSVVGFDNITEAQYLELTTVDQHLSDMGYIATQMLINLINDLPIEEQIHKIQTQLLDRNSTQALVGAVV